MGQRVIAQMLEFCRDIQEVKAPVAIMLNYRSNGCPSTERQEENYRIKVKK